MDLIDRLGPARVSLEGVGELEGQKHPVHFHLAQVPDGRIYLSLRRSTGWLHPESAAHFTGLATSGEIVDRVEDALTVVDTSRSNFDPPLTLFESLAVAHSARVRRSSEGREPHEFFGVRLAIANLHEKTWPRLTAGQIRIDVRAVGGYDLLAEAAERAGGYFHTHVARLWVPPPHSGDAGQDDVAAQTDAGAAFQSDARAGLRLAESKEGLQEVIDALLLTLSLITGSPVGYLELTTGLSSGGSSSPQVRLLNAPILRQNAGYPHGLAPAVEPQELFDAILVVPDRRQVRGWIQQLAEACNHDIFLESRGFNAVALIDVLIQHFDELTPVPDPLSKTKRQRIVRGALSGARESARELKLGMEGTDEAVELVRRAIQHVGQASFRDRLEYHLLRLDIAPTELAGTIAGAVTKTRNSLVHCSQFVRNERPMDEYRRLLPVAIALVTRAVGYGVPLDISPAYSD